VTLLRVIIAVVATTLVVSLLCIWYYPSYRDFTASNTTWNGIREFSREYNAEIIDTLDALSPLSHNATVIAIHYIGYVEQELAQIKRFIEDGGNLILMDDYGYGNSILEYLGTDVRFTNVPMLDELFCYKNQWLPKVTDLSSRVKESGVEVLLLNHATTLTGIDESAVIAWSSSPSFLDTNENELQDYDELQGPFPIAAELRIGTGRLAVVADPSIMINSMVGRDNNHAFIEYLIGHEKAEPGRLVIDRSHITRAPLELSKTKLERLRNIFSNSYASLGLIAAIFVAVGGYMLKREDILDKW